MQFVTHKATSVLSMMLEKIVFLSKGKKKPTESDVLVCSFQVTVIIQMITVPKLSVAAQMAACTVRSPGTSVWAFLLPKRK